MRVICIVLAAVCVIFAPGETLIAASAMLLVAPFPLIGSAFDPGPYHENLFTRYAQTWELWMDVL